MAFHPSTFLSRGSKRDFLWCRMGNAQAHGMAERGYFETPESTCHEKQQLASRCLPRWHPTPQSWSQRAASLRGVL